MIVVVDALPARLGVGGVAQRHGDAALEVGHGLGGHARDADGAPTKAIVLAAIDRWRRKGAHPRADVETREACEIVARTYEALYVELPVTMELVVEHTDPGLQGDRSTGGTKPATLETGHTINVPLFITTGEKVKVDTRDSSYLGRVKA